MPAGRDDEHHEEQGQEDRHEQGEEADQQEHSHGAPEDIADGAIGSSQLGSLSTRPGTPVTVPGGVGQNANWRVRRATARCVAGERLISGTGEWTNEGANEELAIQEIVYSDSTVTVKGANDQGANRTLLATAYCLGSSNGSNG